MQVGLTSIIHVYPQVWKIKSLQRILISRIHHQRRLLRRICQSHQRLPQKVNH